MTHPIRTFRTTTFALLGLVLTGCGATVVAGDEDVEPSLDEDVARPGPLEAPDETVPRPGALSFEPVAAIVAGDDHVCAQSTTGRVRCWGWNADGQLGQGHTDAIGVSDTVLDHPDLSLGGPAVELAAGGAHNCALLPRGLRCWGRGADLALGRGSYDPTTIGDDETPASASSAIVEDQATMRRLALGGQHSCVVMDGGAVRCWGSSELGALGYGSYTLATGGETGNFGWVPLAGDLVEQLVAGQHHNCMINQAGHVRCWGEGIALGGGGIEHIGDDEPACPAPTTYFEEPAVAVAAGAGFSCGLDAVGQVRCWGAGANGVLGQGSSDDIGDGNDAPPVSLGAPLQAIAAGSHHVCGITDEGGVRCWGSGAHGALGYGSTDDIGDDELPSSMGDVALSEPAVAITAGDSFTCALLESGRVSCWGRGDHGALNQGSTEDLGDPTAVPPFNIFPTRLSPSNRTE